MSVVGLDFGNRNCYVSVARQGGIETVTNDYSLRATPSCVAFAAKTRLMGVAAKQQLGPNLKNTIFSFKHLIGRKFRDPIVQAETQYVPYAIVEHSTGAAGVKVNFLGEERIFTAEQILAMLLLKLKDIADAYLQTKVVDCVIAIPSFWTEAQRYAMIGAAHVVGLNVLRVINETAAVALNYGIYKQDLPEPDAKPRTVVFVDMGDLSTQVSVCQMNKGKLKMLHTVFDPSLGGRDLDAALRDHFADEFKSKFKIDARANPRAWIRLADECEKLKKQMSANSTAIPIAIECFMNDKDVSDRMKRSEFEDICSNVWQRLENLMQRLLKESKINPNNVDAVELVGGSTRMPMVKQIVSTVFRKEPSTTLNQDEAISKGAALLCAILSPTFRVREFNISDVQPYSIKLSWTTEKGDDGEAEVFPEGHSFPFSKILTFYRSQPFVLEASYSYPNTIPYPSTHIGKYRILNVVPTSEGEASKVKVKVRLNPNGNFVVTSASMYERMAKDEEAMDLMENDNEANGSDQGGQGGASGVENGQSTDSAGAADHGNEDKESADVEASPEQSPENPDKSGRRKTRSQKAEAKSTGDKGAAGSSDKKSPSKASVKSIDLPIDSLVMQMSGRELSDFQALESQMQSQDRHEQEKIDAKNSLEEYIYEMRDKLVDSLKPYIRDKDADHFRKQLDRAEEWLYNEGDDAPKHQYDTLRNDLLKLGDPVVERYCEAQDRPRAFEDLARSIQMANKIYEAWLNRDPNYDHINGGEMDKVRKAIGDKQGWFDQHVNGQQRRSLTDPPVVLVSQIYEARTSFEAVVAPILNKPKPKPPTPPPASNQQQQQQSQGSAADSGHPQESGNPGSSRGKRSAGASNPNNVNMEVD